MFSLYVLEKLVFEPFGVTCSGNGSRGLCGQSQQGDGGGWVQSHEGSLSDPTDAEIYSCCF